MAKELNENVEKNSNSIAKNSNSIADLEADVGYLAENQNTLIEQNETINQELEGITHELESFIAYAHAQDQKNLVNEFEIEKNKDAIAKNNESIEDLYDFGHEVAESIGEIHAYTEEVNKTLENLITNSVKNTDNITKNKADIQALESNVEKELLNLSGRLIDQKADIDNNINHIYELAQQQDQHSSDIKTLKKNVEEGLLELSGHLIDQKSDIAQNQTDIQDLATYNELQDQYAQKQTEAIDALNKASSENTQNIEDLAAYNELQDAYAKQQTEAIDA
ncbi:cell surface protein, partial [Moraxella catarrhalis]|nr:cell surface protein [Moraxella catarrhalis]